MVVMPHWLSADSVASAPAVKLRLMGTLPAKRAPIFASTAATEAGSMTPIILSAGRSRLNQSAKARLPTRVCQ